MVALRHLSSFRKTPEMSLINSEINLFITWSANFFILADIAANQLPVFVLTDKNFMSWL